MEDQVENIDGIQKQWLDSAEQNYITMQNLFKSKDYSWALFFGHLVIEKTMKAIYVRKFQTVVFTHDLLRLANNIGLKPYCRTTGMVG